MSSRSNFAHSWEIQCRVVTALFIREMKTRFGIWRMGYLWLLLEPMAHIGIFLLIFEISGKSPPIPGADFPTFLLVGLLPFLTFTRILTSCMHAIPSNAGLFNYTRVKPFDAVLVRALLEGIVATSSFVVLFALFGIYLGSHVEIENLAYFIILAAILWLFSFGLGLIASVYGALTPEITKLVPIFIRPLYFVSGIFFVANSLSDEIRGTALLNPILTANELMRSAFYGNYESEGASLFYFILWTCVLNMIGLLLYQRYRNRLTSPP